MEEEAVVGDLGAGGEVVSLSIELGDIIKIIAPSNSEIHDHVFLVDYVSPGGSGGLSGASISTAAGAGGLSGAGSRKIKLIDTESLDEVILKLDATGNLTDESITTIELLSRAEEKGYARQNNLVVSTWVDIRFGGDIPTIITGMITNLDEDMIEIRTYPEDEMIYINFGYMGIPENLPIEEIRIRAPPSSFGEAAAAGGEGTEAGEAGFLTMGMDAVEYPGSQGTPGTPRTLEERRKQRQLARQQGSVEPAPRSSFGAGENATEQPVGMSDYTMLASAAGGVAGAKAAFPVAAAALREKLKAILIDADQIQVGEELDVLVQTVDIPDEHRRFNLEKQCDDLLDTLITNVPATEKSRSVLSNIQKMVERFKELRHKFSSFDANGSPSIPAPKSALFRPLVNSLMRMDRALRWIIPIVKTRKVIYDIPIDDRTAAEMDIAPRLIQDEREAENELQRQWCDGTITYPQYMSNLSARHFTPHEAPRYSPDVVTTQQVNENITAIIDNLDDFYSSVIASEEIKRRRFVIQKYNMGLSKLQSTRGRIGGDAEGGSGPVLKRTTEFAPLTPNDRMNITGFMTFPEPVIYYSRITLPSINILDKSDLNTKQVHYWDMLRQMMTLTTHEVTNLNTPLDINAHNFLREVKQFILEPGIDERDKYRKFLDVIIPKTRNIFDMMRQYIHGRLTLQDVLAFIEPFLIYQDDLNVKQYDEIVAFLYERVLEYKRNYATNFRKFGRLRSFQYHVRYLGVSLIYKLIVSGKMMDADVFKAYGFQDVQVRSGGTAGASVDDKQRQQMRGQAYAAGLAEQTDYNDNLLSSSELLSRMLALDYAKLYMDAVAITTTELITPFDFNLVLGEQSDKLRSAGAMVGGGRAGAGAGAAAAAAGEASGPKRFGLVLSKNYPNEDAIKEDNDSDIPVYFDKKYDTTNYAFIESYRDQQEHMSDTEFKMFLVDELIKNKKMTFDEAKKEAEAIMVGPGMRPVNDGDYAVVEIEDYVEPDKPGQDLGETETETETETKFLYYKREGGKWVRDTSIPAVIPSSDRNYFCNVDRDCLPFAMDAAKNLMAQEAELGGTGGAGGGGAIAHITAKEGTDAIKKAFLDKMKSEFDAKYQVTRENFTEFVNKKFEYDLKNIGRIMEIQHKEFYKYNDRKYKLGVHAAGAAAAAGDDDDDDFDAIISPMEPLKDKIVAQTDFVKRQYDLMQFITSFTRKANEIMDEDPHWLYCIKSNAKLLPSFYEAIAVAFIQSDGTQGGLNVVIDTICKERGTISDDGEAWVDKFSGAVIKKIEHETEEGFDDAGFKLVTRDMIEADIGEGILKVAKPAAAGTAGTAGAAGAAGGLHGISIVEKYDSPNAKIINNIITTMTGYMGIDLQQEREFIIQSTLALLDTSVPPEEAYRLRSEKLFREKGKHLPPYKETFFQTLLLLTLAYLVVAIQCAIPTPKTRKTHAGCVRSFSGYPLDGEGDTSGMMYIACIAYKIKTSIEPWNTLKSFKKEGDILAKMKTLIDTLIITKPAMKERLETKREYLRNLRAGGAGGGEAVPEELSILRWANFMPPMKSLDNMPTPQNVAADFANQLITDMKRGYHGQHDKLAVLESKCIYFSLSIQQMIHSVVKNSSPLLLNMASEPFLENACCNEPVDRRSQRTIDYFMGREQNIHHHNRIIGFLTKTSREMAVMTRATTIMDNRNTRFQYPNIPAEFNEQTVYRAFIHYCRMNQAASAAATNTQSGEGQGNPVATALYLYPELREICPAHPQDWSPNDIIEDKIRKLKRDSNIFDTSSLARLLRIVNGHTMTDAKYAVVAKTRPTEPVPFQKFEDAILHLERKHASSTSTSASTSASTDPIATGESASASALDQCIIPAELRSLLLTLIHSSSPAYVQEDTEEMRDLKNYLHTANQEMKASILGFLQQNSKQTKSKFREIERILDTLMRFEINKSSTVLMSATDETAAKSIQFMRNTLTRLIDVLPAIIHNGVDFDDTNIPKHWGFSQTHMKDVRTVISSHYTSLKTFYNDHVIKEVIRHAEHHVRDLKVMMENTPFMAEIFFDEEKDAKIAAAAAALAVQSQGGTGASTAASALVAREVDIEKELGERVPHSTRKNIYTMYSVFDRDIVRNLYLFYFFSFMRTYIHLVIETPITIYQSEPTRVIRKSASGKKGAKAVTAVTAVTAAKKKGRRAGTAAAAAARNTEAGAIARTAAYDEDEDDREDEIDPQSRLYSSDAGTLEKRQLVSDMDTVMGDKKALGQRVSELLIAYLRMIEKDKSAIDFNLANIKEKLTRVKDKEKDGVVERIGAMSVGERQLENMMKTHKMGIWSRGTSQTGVVIYDQDYYDEERDEMEKIAQKERLLGRRDYVTDMNREIYVMDALEEDRVAAEIEAHELDMSTGIPEDDDAGEDDTAYIHQHDDEGE